MKTGSTTVNLDGDSYSFNFSKSGGVEGTGKDLTGMDDNKYVYKSGLKMKAASDDKYIVVKCTGDAGLNGIEVQEVDRKDMRAVADPVRIAGTIVTTNEDGETVFDDNYYLLNTSGAVVRTKQQDSV